MEAAAPPPPRLCGAAVEAAASPAAASGAAARRQAAPPAAAPAGPAWRPRLAPAAAALATARAPRRRRRRVPAAGRAGVGEAAAGFEVGPLFDTPPLVSSGEAVVVWLHGFGDTGEQWSQTAPALQQMGLPMLRLIFPTAPLRSTGVGDRGPCRSWYDVESLNPDEIAQQQGPPHGLLESVDYILGLVEPHVKRGVHPSRIILAGYSQGGGLALAAALRAPRPIGGVLMLSSWVAEPLPAVAARGVPVHIFHGAADPVIPVAAAQQSSAMLRAAGIDGSFRAYEGMTQGLCDEEVADLGQTLYTILH